MKFTHISVGLVLLFSSTAVWAQTGEVSFTPTGFKFPIMKITMAKNSGFTTGTHLPTPSNEQTLYSCSSTDETQCLVDLTSQTALDAISASAKGISVDVGTYDLLNLYSCASGKGGSSQVSVWLKGFFAAGSTPAYYYTDTTNTITAASPSTSATAQAAATFTEITNWGCATKTIILATPLVVGDPSASASPSPSPSPSPSASPVATASLNQTLTVIVDNTNLANSTPTTSSGMGGCKVPTSTARGVCVNIPAILPYVGSGTTTTKRFLLSHSNVSVGAINTTYANAQVIVPMAGTTPLTVFAGPYYSETSVVGGANVTTTAIQSAYQGPTYNTSTDVSTFVNNGDGTINFKQGGSADSNGGVFTSFPLAGGTGTLKSQDGTATWYYNAALQ